ncbi:MAG: YgiT-type zinc finger protein [Euryarchaeota archaeon]|nr:YgiT-type zinc finger protein [Euryarchaeota archaeon]
MEEIVPICPICGGNVMIKEVEKIVKGGSNVAILKVKAGVCSKCGERIYSKDIHEKIQKVREELELGRTEGFEVVGRTYRYKVTA